MGSRFVRVIIALLISYQSSANTNDQAGHPDLSYEYTRTFCPLAFDSGKPYEAYGVPHEIGKRADELISRFERINSNPRNFYFMELEAEWLGKHPLAAQYIFDSSLNEVLRAFLLSFGLAQAPLEVQWRTLDRIRAEAILGSIFGDWDVAAAVRKRMENSHRSKPDDIELLLDYRREWSGAALHLVMRSLRNTGWGGAGPKGTYLKGSPSWEKIWSVIYASEGGSESIDQVLRSLSPSLFLADIQDLIETLEKNQDQVSQRAVEILRQMETSPF